MHPVAVRILHPTSIAASEPLEMWLSLARRANARRLRQLFHAAGARDVRVDQGERRDGTFGGQLRSMVEGLPQGAGIVVVGSGSIPLARLRDARELLEVAGSGRRRALANNRYSADVVAVGAAATLATVPDLPNDNALPRWLEEEAGYELDDRRGRWRLAIDLDSPLDALLAGSTVPNGLDVSAVAERIDWLAAVAADRRAELVVAGRTSSAALRWLERRTASRTRALIEERGLRAAWLGQAEPRRPARSVLGLVLDDRGPEALGPALSELGDGAIVDSRVLLAHRLGSDESGWPSAEDRFASDLLLPEHVEDPWLRAVTKSARDAPIPVLLGGHTLVGPGIRLVLGRRGRRG